MTIEDAAELQLKQPHLARLETRPANLEGTGAVRQRQLLVNSLRMRPDRIIVGEVRGEEALDMLQAMNTGHDGSLTTVHANTPRDAVSRLEVMVTLANANMHLTAIRQQIASAVHILVQCARLSDGTRRVTNITEVTGIETDIVSLQDIFVFEKHGLSRDGRVLGGSRPPASCRSSTKSCLPRALNFRFICSTRSRRWGPGDPARFLLVWAATLLTYDWSLRLSRRDNLLAMRRLACSRGAPAGAEPDPAEADRRGGRTRPQTARLLERLRLRHSIERLLEALR